MTTVGSLFSGIGGIDLGLERAGMKVIWQSEIDPYASKILARHWPTVPNLGDITTIDWSTVERPDLVCGGFPCQPLSDAGAQRGQADKRWLWPLFASAIRHLRPRYVLVENVPGLLTVTGGRAAEEVFGDLAEYGYDAEWASIPAAAVGAPHLRYRVFILAHANGQRLEERPERNGQPEAWVEAPLRDDTVGLRALVADPDAVGRDGRARYFGEGGRPQPADGGGAWATEPGLGRVAHGVPARVDRLRCLGNAVVPQVAEYVGRQLMSALNDGDADGR